MTVGPYQIAAFTHAARERSFSKAAHVMGVTQSSITQHVAKLEKAMGIALFVRYRTGIELTRPGRELFAISDRIRTLEQLIEERVDAYRELSTGHLRIVATAPRPAMPIVAEFAARYPGVQISFILVSWMTAMQQIRAREIDVAIITDPERDQGLFVHELRTTRYVAVARAGHEALQRKSVSLSDLARQTLILPEDGSLTQRVVLQEVSRHGIVLDHVIKMATFPVIKEAILHGIGIGILLEDSFFPSGDLSVRPLRELATMFADCLVTPSDKSDLRCIRSFIEVAEAMSE
jgi:DNA-binding transcriptional LysR family regulator